MPNTDVSTKAIPTSRFQYLQPELLLLIFEAVNGPSTFTSRTTALSSKTQSTTDFSSLSLVCRSWSYTAQTFLFMHIEPKSLRSLNRLHNVLRITNPGLGKYVLSLQPPMFSTWYMMPRKRRWRAQNVTQSVSRAKIKISEIDYLHMLKLFHRVAECCPNIMVIGAPISILSTSFGFGTHFQIPQLLTSKLRSLTLSPLVFPGPPTLLSPIDLPELRTLILQNLAMFSPHLASFIKTPKLQNLRIHDTCGDLVILESLMNAVTDTIDTLDIKGSHFHVGSDDDILVLLDEGMSVYTTHTFDSISNFAGDALTRGWLDSEFNKFASLKRLELSACTSATFVELSTDLCTLEELYITYTNVYDPSSVFRMVGALANLVKFKEERSPKLRRIGLKWRFMKGMQLSQLMLRNLCLVLAFCLSKRCEAYGVRLEIELHALDNVLETYAWYNSDERCRDSRRWSRKLGIRSLIDRGLNKIGRKAS